MTAAAPVTASNSNGLAAPRRVDVRSANPLGCVLLAVPDGVDRRRLGLALAGEGRQVMACGDGLPDLVGRIEGLRPEVVVVDLGLLDGRSRVLRTLTRAADPSPVLVLIDDTDDDVALIDALTQGAGGVIVRNRPQDAEHALRAVLDGQVAIPRTMVGTIVNALRSQDRTSNGEGPLAHLTERERRVLDMLGQGMSTREIADELVVEPVTVRSHVAAAVRKLGVPDRHAAASLVRRLNVRTDGGPGR